MGLAIRPSRRAPPFQLDWRVIGPARSRKIQIVVLELGAETRSERLSYPFAAESLEREPFSHPSISREALSAARFTGSSPR